jgi:hypothetical protein
VAGFRYALIVGLGAAMGIQNAAARRIAVPDLTTTGLTPVCYPLAIALVTIVLGAVTGHPPEAGPGLGPSPGLEQPP